VTLGVDAATIKTFDTFRKKRNISDYVALVDISGLEANEMHELAERLRVDVEAWIQKKPPPSTLLRSKRQKWAWR